MTGAHRLLVVSYYYHPTPSVGSVRVGGLVKYLPDFGWRATVVTPRRPGRNDLDQPLAETEDADLGTGLKRLLGVQPEVALKDAISGSSSPTAGLGLRTRAIDLVRSIVAVPDTNRGWIPIAARAGRQLLAQQPFDAILTTSPPPSVHLVGSRLVRSSGLPWVADLRDLWSLDHNSTAPRWRRGFDRILERRTFQTASALVAVSEPLAADLQPLHPDTTVRSILNGYDPDETGPADRLDDRFTLTHTGTFYQGRRDPTLLFKALANLVASDSIDRQRVRIRLYARHESWVGHLAETLDVADMVELLPWGSRDAALRAQHEAQVLLLLHWGGERERGVYTGKVFEYLAARRPIVMIGGGAGVLHDLLEETGAGVHVTGQNSLEGVLLDLWREFEANGAVAWRGREEMLARYSHRRMAREFAELLDEVCGR